MQFHCKRVEDTKWGIDLPKMQFMAAGTYTFKVTAVIDGYYFEAHRGTLNVQKSPEVYVKTEDAKMRVESREVEKPAPKKSEPVPEQKIEPVDSTNGRVIQEPANEGDNVTRDQVRDIISRLTKSEDVTEEQKPVAKSEPVAKPEADPLAEARKVARKLLSEEQKTGASALAKTDDSKVKNIIREHKKQEAERKKLREQQLAQQHARARKQTAAVVKQNPPEPASTPIAEKDNERDARAKAVLESLHKEEKATAPAPKFKRGGKVVK
jgi:hypothetical protein